MVYHGETFPKIHDLTRLAKLCAEIDKDFSKLLQDTDILSQYYLTSRYPLEYRMANKKEAEEALKIAEKIIFLIKRKVLKKKFVK